MRALITVMFFCLLSGCATMYKPDGLSGGYTDTQLSENTFRVTFNGNGYTKPERAADFALLRCAEVSIEHGYDYFSIINSNDNSNNHYMKMPTQSTTSAQASIHRNNVYGTSNTVTSGGHLINVKTSSSSNIIECYKEKNNSNNLIYDANFVTTSISSKYGIKTNTTKNKISISDTKKSLLSEETTNIEKRYRSNLALKRIDLGMTENLFAFDQSKWEITENKPGRIEFFHTQSIMSAVIIYEPEIVSFEDIKDAAFYNAKQNYSNSKIGPAKTIYVNDNKMKCYEITTDIHKTIHYSTSGEFGTVQIIVWSNEMLFNKYILEAEEFLNGFLGNKQCNLTWESKSLEAQRKG